MLDLRPLHARLLVRQQREWNVARRDMAREIADAISVCGDRPTYDPGCHVAYSRAIDAIMDKYYGPRRGDLNSPFGRMILDPARRAYEAGVRVQQQLVRDALKERAPDVLAALEERGKNAT